MRRKRRRPVDAVLDDQPIPFGPAEPGDVDLLRAAIELRQADPGAGVPTEAFVDQLRDRLAAELEAGGAPHRAGGGAAELGPAGAGAAGGGQAGGGHRAGPARIPRRALLAGAGAAVAAGVAGVVADRTLLGADGGGTTTAAGPREVDPVDGAWVPVAPAAALTDGAARPFTTPGIVGFLSTAAGGEPLAVSGACTHRGCLLRLNADAGQLDCPCHRTAFALDGRTLFHQLAAEPPPLPRLRARRAGDQIEVFVPTEHS
jgi:Rieske Fe-S protein